MRPTGSEAVPDGARRPSAPVRLSELVAVPVAEADLVLDHLARSAKAVRSRGQRAVLEARVREYEIRYEMSSDDMRRLLRDGALEETADIARWLMVLGARDNRTPEQGALPERAGQGLDR